MNKKSKLTERQQRINDAYEAAVEVHGQDISTDLLRDEILAAV